MRLPDGAARARAALRPRRSWAPLASLVVAQWLAVAYVALNAQHNGWLYYQGGDQSWYYTTAWNFGHGLLSPAVVGYAWPMALAPIAGLAGANFLAAIPFVIFFQALVLIPVAVAAFYGLASRIGGRTFGYGATLFWVLAPLLAIPLFVERYHDRWVDVLLPQLTGLGSLADLPSLVAVLVAAYLVLRALDTRGSADSLLAGAVAGLALGVKPANGLFLVGAVLAFAVARRPHELSRFALGLVPGVVTLAVWKQRGLGELPLLTYPDARLAAGVLSASLDPYLRIDFDQLGRNFAELREYFWSLRLLQWAPLAGLLGVLRVSRPAGALLGGWFFAFLLFKGGASGSSVQGGSFFRLIMPALPAYVLLFAAVVLLVPAYGRRIAASRRVVGAPLSRRTLQAGLALLAAIPFLAVAVLPVVRGERAVQYPRQGIYVPVLRDFLVTAVLVTPGDVRLEWFPPETRGTDVHYRIFRVETPDLVVDGVECGSPPSLPAQCFLQMEGETNLPQTATVRAVEPGGYAFRVAVTSDARNASDADIIFLSPPRFVGVPRP